MSPAPHKQALPKQFLAMYPFAALSWGCNCERSFPGEGASYGGYPTVRFS